MTKTNIFIALCSILGAGLNDSLAINQLCFPEYSLPEKQTAVLDSGKRLANNKDSAMVYYDTGILKNNSRQYAAAVICFTKALNLDSALATAYLHRAYAKNKLMDYKSALKDYDLALQFPLTWEESYEAYFNKGLTQVLLENLKGALSDFSSSIKLNPEYAVAYYNRSIVKGKVGDYYGELADINKSISLKPADSYAFNSRGIVHSIIGNYREALQDYNQAILLDKKNIHAYFNRGIIHYEEKEYHAAINDFSFVLEIRQDADTYNRRANAKCRLGDVRGAFEDYAAAIKIEPNAYIAYLNRGQLNFDLKDYQSAVDDYTSAIKILPDFSTAFYNRGLAKRKLHDYKGEISDYNMAIEFNPNYQDAYYNRGLAKYSMDDQRGGCADLNTAVKQGSNPAYDYLIVHCR